MDYEEYERLQKLEEEKEYYRTLSENPNAKIKKPAHLKEIIKEEIDQNRRRIDLFSAISHLIGIGLAIAGLVILLVESVIHATAWHVVSFSIFGSSLILLYLASTLYHWFPYPSRVKSFFRRIDHSMIYLLIAGTYTPVCLTALRGWWGWTIFGVIWALAVWGIIVKAAWLAIPRVLSSLSYILMGWMVVVAFVPLMQAIPLGGILWLVAGGLFYTVGTLFYGLDKKYPSRNWFNFHDVFHLFILAGSFCHFWLMLKYIMNAGV